MNIQHYDSIVLGAGISGISSAYHLKRHHPNKTLKILERRDNIGGTWDLFDYPGIRSDSDMYTFGYNFHHWDDDTTIAPKKKILSYLNEVIDKFNIRDHIQYNSYVVKAEWSSSESQWLVSTKDGEQFSCQFLFFASGFYDYDNAHNPNIPGIDNFKGDVINPQFWPKDYDYSGKKVVVVGSGATAITIIPSMVDKAETVTMLQRSPGYIVRQPGINPKAKWLKKWIGRWAARWWFISTTIFAFYYCKAFPERSKGELIDAVKEELGDKFDAKHFTPDYFPWDQRVLVSPDGDFFKVIREGQAEIVTDHIAGFDAGSIELKSGERLDADLVVTATGFKLNFFADINIEVDGKAYDPVPEYMYKGTMVTGLPNAFRIAGSTNNTWTLNVDLTNYYIMRLLKHLDKGGTKKVVPIVTKQDMPAPTELPLTSGYVIRAVQAGFLPQSTTISPWTLGRNFIADNWYMRFAPVVNENMSFS